MLFSCNCISSLSRLSGDRPWTSLSPMPNEWEATPISVSTTPTPRRKTKLIWTRGGGGCFPFLQNALTFLSIMSSVEWLGHKPYKVFHCNCFLWALYPSQFPFYENCRIILHLHSLDYTRFRLLWWYVQLGTRPHQKRLVWDIAIATVVLIIFHLLFFLTTIPPHPPDKAYVCHQDKEAMSKGRETRTDSPWRTRCEYINNIFSLSSFSRCSWQFRSVEENLVEFERMRWGCEPCWVRAHEVGMWTLLNSSAWGGDVFFLLYRRTTTFSVLFFWMFYFPSYWRNIKHFVEKLLLNWKAFFCSL
mgnify:CR=1 FL=1